MAGYWGEGLTIDSLAAIAFYFLVTNEGERVHSAGTCARHSFQWYLTNYLFDSWIFPIEHHSWCRHCTEFDSSLLTCVIRAWYFRRRPPTKPLIVFLSIFFGTFSGCRSVFLAWLSNLYARHARHARHAILIARSPTVKRRGCRNLTFISISDKLQKWWRAWRA